jgi:hypothetical protein
MAASRIMLAAASRREEQKARVMAGFLRRLQQSG